MIRIAPHKEGSILPVRAQPGAKRNGIVGEQNEALKVAVTAPADKGKANDAIQVTLFRGLGLRRSQVALLAGAASRDKRFLIIGVTPAELAQQIQAILEENESG